MEKKIYCLACDALITNETGRWLDDNAEVACDGLGGMEHIPDPGTLDSGHLKAVLLNYYGDLEMRYEAREGDPDTKAEMNRVLRIMEEFGLDADSVVR